MKQTLILLALLGAMAGCKKQAAEVLYEKQAFDTLLSSKHVSLYTLKNSHGMAVQITNYGARVVDLWVPAADGSFKDVVWGYETIKGYLNSTDLYCGPIVGRYGNRIGAGKFSIDGVGYTLSQNEGVNHLHGGKGGFSTRVWDADSVVTADGVSSLKLTYHSPAGEEGYPGAVDISVTYSLNDKNELKISYLATTDAPTIVNPTSHCYFNLHGSSAQSTNTHILYINASHYTPTDSTLIPTGEIATLDGTPLDFRKPTAIGQRIAQDFKALKYGKGYDHNFVLDRKSAKDTSYAAEVYEPATGIVMKIYTDQPGLQFYSGNFMNGKDTGKRGDVHNYRTGVALEAQNFPDAPNHSNFPNAILKPGEKYTQTTIYSFGVKK